MRHRKSINHLGRTSSHRKAMLANMASSLILHKRITTTTAKAKALKVYVEPLMTKAKDDSTHSRRVVFSYLQDKEAVTELFREVSAKIADRPGGYTRILKTGTRLGDNADMCIIELVDFNENYITGKSEVKTKSTRRRRGSKKAGSEQVEEKTEKTVEAKEVKTEVEEVKTEAKVEDAPVKEAKKETVVEEPKTEEVVEEIKAEDAPVKEEKSEDSEEEKKEE